MLPSFLITFREALEASLVVGIILTFLVKTGNYRFQKFVWYGVIVGVFISLLIGVGVHVFFGTLSGQVEQIFEGILMFTTVGFLTWMILWIHRQKNVITNLKKNVALHVSKNYGIGISILIATAVFREGTETVLYLQAVEVVNGSYQLYGALAGIVGAVIIGYLVFMFSLKVNFKLVFNITTVFLLFFAAGLFAHGVHEFQEAGIFPVFYFDPIFNISHILDNNSALGGILRTLFGYTAKPTMLEIISYEIYFVTILWLLRFTTLKLNQFKDQKKSV